jgi:hypothetical protein
MKVQHRAKSTCVHKFVLCGLSAGRSMQRWPCLLLLPLLAYCRRQVVDGLAREVALGTWSAPGLHLVCSMLCGTDGSRIAREVAFGTWSVRLHSRRVVRPGCVLLGGVAPNVPMALGLWVCQPHTP